MLVINQQQVRALLTPSTSIELMRKAMIQASSGNAEMPLRWGMNVPGSGFMGMMPGYIDSPRCFGIKVINMMNANQSGVHSSHLGAMMLFEADNGLPLALIDAGEITALRTAATSALATELLSRPNSRKLAIIGSGEQAKSHILALSAVRDFDQVSVFFRNMQKAKAFQESLTELGGPVIDASDNVEHCLADADIVCTVSSADTPLFKSELIKPGCHLNLVGASVKEKQEVECALLPRSRYYIDYHPSAQAQAGELINAQQQGLVGKDFVQGEIGELLQDAIKGRTSDEEITIYRSLGVASQDLVLSHYLYQQALSQKVGSNVDFP